MAKRKKFLGRLLAAIGSIFAPAFKGAEKAYNDLSPEQQQALKDGSGILDFINTRLDILPADVKTGLVTQFPNMDIERIERITVDVAKTFNLIKEEDTFPFEVVIEKLQAYLIRQKQKGGKFWATASHGIAVLFAVLFGDTKTKVSVFTSLMEYVYHAFIKKDKSVE